MVNHTAHRQKTNRPGRRFRNADPGGNRCTISGNRDIPGALPSERVLFAEAVFIEEEGRLRFHAVAEVHRFARNLAEPLAVVEFVVGLGVRVHEIILCPVLPEERVEQPEQVHPRAVSAETLVGRKQAKLPVKLPAVIADQVAVRPGDPVLLPELFLPVVVEKHPEPRKIPRKKVTEPVLPRAESVTPAEQETDDRAVRDRDLAKVGLGEIFI